MKVGEALAHYSFDCSVAGFVGILENAAQQNGKLQSFKLCIYLHLTHLGAFIVLGKF